MAKALRFMYRPYVYKKIFFFIIQGLGLGF